MGFCAHAYLFMYLTRVYSIVVVSQGYMGFTPGIRLALFLEGVTEASLLLTNYEAMSMKVAKYPN